VPVVQLAPEVAIGARPDTDDAEVNTGRQRRGPERRAMPATVDLQAAGDIVGVAHVGAGARMTPGAVRLVQVDEVAAGDGEKGRGGA
jgi:hypothetical protein